VLRLEPLDRVLAEQHRRVFRVDGRMPTRTHCRGSPANGRQDTPWGLQLAILDVGGQPLVIPPIRGRAGELKVTGALLTALVQGRRGVLVIEGAPHWTASSRPAASCRWTPAPPPTPTPCKSHNTWPRPHWTSPPALAAVPAWPPARTGLASCSPAPSWATVATAARAAGTRTSGPADGGASRRRIRALHALRRVQASLSRRDTDHRSRRAQPRAAAHLGEAVPGAG
jgi:hypothetical protein